MLLATVAAPAAGAVRSHPDATGARDGRGHPPSHAAEPDGPPPHAHSPAPEERPPTHSRARAASAQHGGGDASVAPPPGHVDGATSAPGTDGDADGTGVGTELDTDVVVDGAARPDGDRSPSAVGSPVVTAPVLALTATPVLASGSAAPATAFSTATSRAGTASADGDRAGTSAGGAASDRDVRAAATFPPSVPDRFPTSEGTRRVVVPVLLLVAGLLYLLGQGRIDRRGTLLLPPRAAGTEDDDVVYQL